MRPSSAFLDVIETNGAIGLVVAPRGRLSRVLTCAIPSRKIRRIAVLADPEIQVTKRGGSELVVGWTSDSADGKFVYYARGYANDVGGFRSAARSM